MTNSVYDIDLKSWDGKEDFLQSFKGKVTLVVNVTADCGNAPQYGIIEEIYQKYRDKGFEVLAVPTNEYCGPGVTYGKWEEGICSAEDARTYAKKTYGVSYEFSEKITSKPGAPWDKKLEADQKSHPLYESLLSSTTSDAMYGNFEKFLIDKNGNIADNWPNYTLLDYAKVGLITGNNPGEMDIEKEIPMGAKESYKVICSAIEKALAA
jgi:glutathione peroxidase